MALSYTKKMPPAETVYVVDFFCGCGGMSYGFANTRQSHLAYRVLGGIDLDESALATYQANVGSPGARHDIRWIEESPERLREAIPGFAPETQRPMVFIGCAPCQGFSAHRKKDDRDDARNSLLMSFANICAHYLPDFVAMENVPEVLGGRFQLYFAAAVARLTRLGYELSIDAIDMSLYGVPQRRRRAIVLGGLRRSVSLPPPVLPKSAAPTVRDAISHLFPLDAGARDPHDPMHLAPAHSERILARIRKTPRDGGDRRSLPDEDQLRCHASVDGSATPGFTDVYGRLRWDLPSVTITAKSSTPSCGRFLHPEQDRNISVREAALLQGFPHSYQFHGGLVSMYRQIGEAVPPVFARFLAWQILDTIRKPDALPPPLVRLSETRHVGGLAPAHAKASLRAVDCFCGAGGIALGFEACGYDVAFAFDLDGDCVTTFRKNISPCAQVLDIASPDASALMEERVGDGPFVVVGGPPCQGFSQQRRGASRDPRNSLVIRYAEAVLGMRSRPEAIVLENVTYLDSPRGRETYGRYSEILGGAGYRLFRHDLNSAGFGVPQLRNRIVVVALVEDIAAQYAGPAELTPAGGGPSARHWPG